MRARRPRDLARRPIIFLRITEFSPNPEPVARLLTFIGRIVWSLYRGPVKAKDRGQAIPGHPPATAVISKAGTDHDHPVNKVTPRVWRNDPTQVQGTPPIATTASITRVKTGPLHASASMRPASGPGFHIPWPLRTGRSHPTGERSSLSSRPNDWDSGRG